MRLDCATPLCLFDRLTDAHCASSLLVNHFAHSFAVPSLCVATTREAALAMVQLRSRSSGSLWLLQQVAEAEVERRWSETAVGHASLASRLFTHHFIDTRHDATRMQSSRPRPVEE